MKKIVFFITHTTLNEEHANATFYSLSKQNVTVDEKFDRLYLYNTHQDELSNNYLLELYNYYNLSRYFNDIKIFNYDKNTPKKLSSDIKTICDYSKKTYDETDRILLLKSDCLLSVNYFDDLLKIPEDKDIFFTAPFVCAKARISDEEIFEYSSRDRYIESDEITFFVEDQYNSGNNDFRNRPEIKVTDDSIKFTSCRVVTDFSCHYVTINLTDKINFTDQTWGGVKYYNMRNYLVETNRSFVIHKYHEIVSKNRMTDREGPVKEWLNS